MPCKDLNYVFDEYWVTIFIYMKIYTYVSWYISVLYEEGNSNKEYAEISSDEDSNIWEDISDEEGVDKMGSTDKEVLLTGKYLNFLVKVREGDSTQDHIDEL